ncbi:MAG: serine/threonine protein kinase [Acidobacteria bacterium]|nr:serine/threonine protein kinase [Acidobacteriota bacterium]
MMRARVSLGLCLIVILFLPVVAQDLKSHAGFHPVRDANGRWGFIDRTGRLRIAPRYDTANEFSDGVAYVFYWEGEKRINGIVDTSGKFTRLETNDYEVSFHDGLARFQSPGGLDRKFGYMDKNGRIVIEPQFSYAGDFSEGRAWIEVLKDREWLYGFIDKTGKIVVAPQFTQQPGDFREGVAKAQGLYGLGFIDRNGKFVISAKLQQVDWSFAEGLVAAVYQGESPRGVYLDRAGQVAFEIPLWQQRTARQREMAEYRWHLVAPFSEGLAPVQSFNKVGFINKSAQVVIEPLFRDTNGFCEGLAGVKIIGSDGNYVWGFIDRTGKFVIDAQFREVKPFAGGLAHVVTLDDTQQLIDSSGKVIWQKAK